MVPYKIVRADSGDAWVEVSTWAGGPGCGQMGHACCEEGENGVEEGAVTLQVGGWVGDALFRHRCHGGGGVKEAWLGMALGGQGTADC